MVGPLFVWHVGDRVSFDLHIDRLNEPHYRSDYQYVFERFGGEEWVSLGNIDGKDMLPVEGT